MCVRSGRGGGDARANAGDKVGDGGGRGCLFETTLIIVLKQTHGNLHNIL